MVIITSYPTRANGTIVLVNSQTGFAPIFISTILQTGKFVNLAHYFPYDVKLGLLVLMVHHLTYPILIGLN